jgi:glutathione S-transferase
MADLYVWPALATIAALLVYFSSFILAARMRGKHGVKAPSIDGPEEFKRALRIQANTLEQLALFLPSLWLFAVYLSPLWATILGGAWVAGRILYIVTYFRDPVSRGPGFVTAMTATGVLLVGALICIVAQL